jgi:hypothetical protein
VFLISGYDGTHMAAITVKKKSKLTFKDDVPPEAMEGGGEESAMAEEASGAPVLTRYSHPDGASYTFAGICGLITLVIFLALLVFQFIEFDFYKDAFPMNMGAGMMSTPERTVSPSPAPSGSPSAVTPAQAAPAPEAAPAASEPTASSGTGGEAPPATAPAEKGNTRSKVDGRNATINAEIDK